MNTGPSRLAKFDETAVRKIVQRAVELDDLKAAAISKDALGEIAGELGISEAALDQAVDEYEMAKAAREDATWSRRTVVLVLFGTASATGLASFGTYEIGSLIDLEISQTIFTIMVIGQFTVLACAEGAVAALLRGPRRLLKYNFINTAVWMGWGIGAALQIGGFDPEVLVPGFVLGAGIGSALVNWFGRHEGPKSKVAKAVTILPRFLSSARTRISDWTRTDVEMNGLPSL